MRWSGTDRPVLVIGYGNSLRRDDGAGLILAEQLATAWQQAGKPVSVLTSHQLDPELASDIARSGAAIVLFVDAALPWGDDSPTVRLTPVTSGASASQIGHHLTPATVLLYATELFGYQGKGWMLSVPGFDFEHGEGLSEECTRLICECVSENQSVWDQIQSQA